MEKSIDFNTIRNIPQLELPESLSNQETVKYTVVPSQNEMSYSHLIY